MQGIQPDPRKLKVWGPNEYPEHSNVSGTKTGKVLYVTLCIIIAIAALFIARSLAPNISLVAIIATIVALVFAVRRC